MVALALLGVGRRDEEKTKARPRRTAAAAAQEPAGSSFRRADEALRTGKPEPVNQRLTHSGNPQGRRGRPTARKKQPAPASPPAGTDVRRPPTGDMRLDRAGAEYQGAGM